MAADDFLNTPPDHGLPAGLDSSSTSGNRPASGARRATPGEVLSQSFQGAQNAGDFLGLDTEFTGSQDPNQALGGGPLDLVEPPSTYSQDPGGYVPEPAPLPASDPVQDFAEAPSAFEFGEDLGSDESALEAAEESPSSKRGLLVGGLLVAALAATGVYFGPELLQRFQGGESAPTTEVASESWPAKKTAPPAKTPAEPAQTPESGDGTGDKSIVDPAKPSAEVAKSSEPASGTQSAPKLAPKPRATGEVPSIAPSDDTKSPVELVAAQPSLSGPSPRKVEFPNLDGQGYEWASEDQLELIWRGSEVPMEAVHAPAKTLMPRVGHVRVFTLGGDVFAGRLYAVGQGLVWIDGEPGRIGLDGAKIERIEVLPPDPTGTPVASGSELLGGRRVRVKVPGGMLYGSVLKADGEDVMLALETGGRVRVKATDVQDLGSGRAVVVRQ